MPYLLQNKAKFYFVETLKTSGMSKNQVPL